jgi:hypothetical protein
MFTDGPVTPVRLEILVDLLRKLGGGLAREEVYHLLQPKSLQPDPELAPAKQTVRAALELGLAEEAGRKLWPSDSCKKEGTARSAVLRAFDDRVLASTDSEKYFALFYAYYLFLGKAVYDLSGQSSEDWAKQFNDVVFYGEARSNPFNPEKLRGLHRWFGYVGLGWYDPAENFQANPYDRIARALPKIFGGADKLTAAKFMKGLAAACPELDGGQIFQEANRKWRGADKQCTLGLGHALIELHEDKVILLDCPADCSDWSLGEADPPRDDHFKGDRFVSVAWKKV